MAGRRYAFSGGVEATPGVGAGDVRRGAAVAVILAGLTILAVATRAMMRGVDPFATSYYIFAWYATLLILDGVVALNGGARDAHGVKRFLLLERPAYLVTLLFWSAIVWLFYELLNFRLQNWYYVFVPDGHITRWATTVISFATVLPAVFVTMAMLRGFGVAEHVRWRRLVVTPRLLRTLQVAGAVMLVLAMLEPRYFFPLVWGGGTLLVEPVNYRRDPGRSLLGDLERGSPTRILRLLLGGMIIGLLWEMFNFEARAKWIYTVPFFEDLKLFEMPVLGFFGFPPFAVECFSLWQALVLGGLAVPRWTEVRPAPGSRRVGAVLAAVAFSGLVIAGMEMRTFSSYTPRLDRLPEIPAAVLETAGFDVFTLASAAPSEVVERLEVAPEEAADWVETARLAALRGIGVRNAQLLQQVGIHCVAALAVADDDELATRLEALTGRPVLPARVRVWIRAARRLLGESTANTAMEGSNTCVAA